jgi:imidazolonepropionase-like amidohydrolase
MTTSRTAYVPDRVFDSVEGRMLEGRAVLVDGGLIEAVVSIGDVPSDVARIDLSGYSLLPGLMDMHCHLIGELDSGQGYSSLVERSGAQEVLSGVRNAREALRAGVTTVRDIGTFRAFADVALRDAIEDGTVEGPRMMCAGAYVTCPGGGGDVTGLAPDVDAVVPRELRFGVTTGVDQMRTNVRQILRYGADFIKIIATGAVLTSGTDPGLPEFTEDELRAAVEEAELAGTHVACHAHGAVGIKRAVRAGARSIEHGSLMDDEAIELMADRGTYLVADMYDGDYMLEPEQRARYSAETIRKTEWTNDEQRAGFGKAVAAGVKIANGTDCGIFPHRDIPKNLAYYVRYGGISDAKALQSATRWSAELMGWQDRVGTVAPGSFADLIAVAGDPSADVRLVEDVRFVVKGGVLVRDDRG